MTVVRQVLYGGGSSTQCGRLFPACSSIRTYLWREGRRYFYGRHHTPRAVHFFISTGVAVQTLRSVNTEAAAARLADGSLVGQTFLTLCRVLWSCLLLGVDIELQYGAPATVAAAPRRYNVFKSGRRRGRLYMETVQGKPVLCIREPRVGAPRYRVSVRDILVITRAPAFGSHAGNSTEVLFEYPFAVAPTLCMVHEGGMFSLYDGPLFLGACATPLLLRQRLDRHWREVLQQTPAPPRVRQYACYSQERLVRRR